MIPFGEARHPVPDIDDNAGAFVAEDRWKQPLGVGARQGELVGMADAGRLDLDQHLPVLWAVELDRLDRELLSSLVSNSSASLHERLPQFTQSTTSGRHQAALDPPAHLCRGKPSFACLRLFWLIGVAAHGFRGAIVA